MPTVNKDKLIRELFEALDDEVEFCIHGNFDIAEQSVELLKTCEKLEVGKSRALELLEKFSIKSDARGLL